MSEGIKFYRKIGSKNTTLLVNLPPEIGNWIKASPGAIATMIPGELDGKRIVTVYVDDIQFEESDVQDTNPIPAGDQDADSETTPEL